MAKSKRGLADDAVVELAHHESPKKRAKHSNGDAQLAKIYNDLADDVQEVRVKTAGDLLKKLSEDPVDQSQAIDDAEARLIRGLCSGRKAARLGFSIALVEVFRLTFRIQAQPREDNAINLRPTIDNIVKLTTVSGNVSGQEKRDYGLGRRFAFQALLQADIVLESGLQDDQWKHFVSCILDLASQKRWLQRECGTMLHDYLTSTSGKKLSQSQVLIIVEELLDHKLAKTPEGVGIWLDVSKLGLVFPSFKLPKNIWHQRDPLCSKERSTLSKIMLDTALGDDDATSKKTGARQASPSFVWSTLLSHLYNRGNLKEFGEFWKVVVASTMFSSSSSVERKALGLQVLTLAIKTAPPSMLPEVIAPPAVLKCILDQRQNPKGYLFDAAKAPLSEMLNCVKQQPLLASVVITPLIRFGAPNFDQLTKTELLEDLMRESDLRALADVVALITSRLNDTASKDQQQEGIQRRILSDLLLSMIRIHRRTGKLFELAPEEDVTPILASWSRQIILSFLSLGYGTYLSDTKTAVSETSRAMIRNRLLSCLGLFVELPVEHAVAAYLLVVGRLFEAKDLRADLGGKAAEVVQETKAVCEEIQTKGGRSASLMAFQMLICMSVIQVFNKEPDSVPTLHDLITCHQSFGSSDSTTMLIELLLSFVSQPSALFRKLAEQVFSAFAPSLTSEGLESLTDILAKQESLSGQQEMFATEEASDQPINGDGVDEGEDVDVEDASDVEMINGLENNEADSEEDDIDDDADESSEAEQGASDDGAEEVAAFEKKLADALGTSGVNEDEDSDDDGSDMDDEQMLALEPHLTTIFKERQKSSSQKQDKKDAKETIVNFKNRVLDLLTIYVKSQYSNSLALDLVLPLTTLIRTTTSKPTAEKAFAVLKQYFEACNKNKSLPSPDAEACLGVLTNVHEEMKLGGSKLHANACSRSSLFLSKVLVGNEQSNYAIIAERYSKLQSEWYLDPKSKVAGSVFTEWTSWSISTRKQT